MRLLPLRLVEGWLGLLLLLLSSHAFAQPLVESASGLPHHAGEHLGEASYQKVTAARLRKAEVLWVNHDLLRSSGFHAEGRALTRELLDAFAYSVPRTGEKGSALFNAEKQKTFYADKYGGEGNWGTLGSGRAMSAGRWQIKGGGDTGLSLQSGDRIGGVSLETGIREAIWGEIAHRELPYGGNRVLALIATGTSSAGPDGTRIPRVLVVREDPLRPAHYMDNEFDRERDPRGERTQQAIAHIERALPGGKAKNDTTRKSRVLEGAREFTRRVAEQYATAFAKRIYHGATSASNFELSGKFLDYDLITALPGHGRVNVLYSEQPFGSTEALKEMVVTDFLRDVFRHVRGLSEGDAKKMEQLFDRTYERVQRREMLRLVGLPDPIAQHRALGDSGRRLSEVLIEIASVPLGGNPRVINVSKDAIGKSAMPGRTSEHDLGRLLTQIAGLEKKSAVGIEAALEPALRNAGLRHRLATAYARFYKDAVRVARQEGIRATALAQFVQHAAAQRNRPMEGLYRPVLLGNIAKVLGSADGPGKRARSVERLIDRVLTNNTRTFRELHAYETPIPGQASRVYSAQTDHVRRTQRRSTHGAKRPRGLGFGSALPAEPPQRLTRPNPGGRSSSRAPRKVPGSRRTLGQPRPRR